MTIRSLVALTLLFPGLVYAQATHYGQLTGVVKDPHGAVLPGASITLSGDDVLGTKLVTSERDGRYIFRALSPGRYDLRVEMPDFAPRVWQDVIIEGGATITINVDLTVAAFTETLTVTGESPTVDVKTTRLGGTFDRAELQDVPSATDMWAVLAQSPGIRMRGYDVGGSHKAQQTGYESYGIRGQNRIVSDGVDSTEGNAGSGFYYDYYSVEEFQVSAGGADVEMNSPGASVVMTVKSGGDEWSGLYLVEYEDGSFVGENSDGELEARGFTGNPNLLFWEAHADLGGPIVRDKAWFFGAFNHFTLDKQRSGVDPAIATDKGIFDNYVAKMTSQLTEKDQLIGYSQWGRKQAPTRGVSVTTPPESAFDQDTWTWVHKAEWQRMWSGRLFSNVQVKHYGLALDWLPKADHADGPWREDTATGVRSGAIIWAPQRFERFKPHVSGQASYYLPSRSGGHDLKFGVEWIYDSASGSTVGSPSPIEYFDNSALGRPHNVDEVKVWNYPSAANFTNGKLDAYAQDVWTLSDRLTVSLGVRLGSQNVFYDESVQAPVFNEIFATGTVPGDSVLRLFNVAPRLGATFDVTGEGITVVKGYFGRFYMNLAQALIDANPVILANKTYNFLDHNENGVYDGFHELGSLVGESGGGATTINEDMTQSFTNEYSVSLEHELAPDTSFRASYVRKELYNRVGQYNRASVQALRENPIPCGDAVFPCPSDPFTGEPLGLIRLPEEDFFVQDPVFDNIPSPDDHYTYDTIQFAAQRRFSGRFFVQGNFDYQWRNEVRQGDSRSAQIADPIGVATMGGFFAETNHPATPNLQKNTNWQGKLLARYIFPRDIAVATNLRYQSGWPWAPIHRVRIPGQGTTAFFLENIENNRSENVTLLDLRFEKSFAVNDRHRVTALVDIFNLANSNSVTNFVLRTGGAHERVIAALDPRTFKIGLRWQF